MQKLLGLSCALVTATIGTTAQAAPWCAYYDPSTYNCGFHSYQQCLETIRGIGGYCGPNHFESYPAPRGPDGRRLRQYR